MATTTPPRAAEIERTTGETRVRLRLALDGAGESQHLADDARADAPASLANATPLCRTVYNGPGRTGERFDLGDPATALRRRRSDASRRLHMGMVARICSPVRAAGLHAEWPRATAAVERT